MSKKSYFNKNKKRSGFQIPDILTNEIGSSITGVLWRWTLIFVIFVIIFTILIFVFYYYFGTEFYFEAPGNTNHNSVSALKNAFHLGLRGGLKI